MLAANVSGERIGGAEPDGFGGLVPVSVLTLSRRCEREKKQRVPAAFLVLWSDPMRERKKTVQRENESGGLKQRMQRDRSLPQIRALRRKRDRDV